jgi:hypothetical protein
LLSVITVGSAVQIKRSRLSSVSTLFTCCGYPDTRQVAVQKDPKHCTVLYKGENIAKPSMKYVQTILTTGNSIRNKSRIKENLKYVQFTIEVVYL